MVDRICISINNRCNLACKYCHFREKSSDIQADEMDVFAILDNVKKYINDNQISIFKIGFVGNGEPLLDFERLKEYILYISDYLKQGRIAAYSITNGINVSKEMLLFFKEHNINLGFSIDGLKDIHNKYRCNSYDKVCENIELFYEVFGYYPSMNCTVGKDVIDRKEETVDFFRKYNSRITFSRMIGQYVISRDEFNSFIEYAKQQLNVRTGGYDCTMYGGKCGAGMNNLFFANGKIFYCGNCIDLPPIGNSNDPLSKFETMELNFDRNYCYKESICE